MKTNMTKSYKVQEAVGSYDHPRPEGFSQNPPHISSHELTIESFVFIGHMEVKKSEDAIEI